MWGTSAYGIRYHHLVVGTPGSGQTRFTTLTVVGTLDTSKGARLSPVGSTLGTTPAAYVPSAGRFVVFGRGFNPARIRVWHVKDDGTVVVNGTKADTPLTKEGAVYLRPGPVVLANTTYLASRSGKNGNGTGDTIRLRLVPKPWTKVSAVVDLLPGKETGTSPVAMTTDGKVLRVAWMQTHKPGLSYTKLRSGQVLGSRGGGWAEVACGGLRVRR